jgi:hypothetical protein
VDNTVLQDPPRSERFRQFLLSAAIQSAGLGSKRICCERYSVYCIQPCRLEPLASGLHFEVSSVSLPDPKDTDASRNMIIYNCGYEVR